MHGTFVHDISAIYESSSNEVSLYEAPNHTCLASPDRQTCYSTIQRAVATPLMAELNEALHSRNNT